MNTTQLRSVINKQDGQISRLIERVEAAESQVARLAAQNRGLKAIVSGGEVLSPQVHGVVYDAYGLAYVTQFGDGSLTVVYPDGSADMVIASRFDVAPGQPCTDELRDYLAGERKAAANA